MKKANGLGSKIDNAIATMQAAAKADHSLTKKQLYDIAVKAADYDVSKLAQRAIWSAVYHSQIDEYVGPTEYNDALM